MVLLVVILCMGSKRSICAGNKRNIKIVLMFENIKMKKAPIVDFKENAVTQKLERLSFLFCYFSIFPP